MTLDRALAMLRASLAAEALLGRDRSIGIACWSSTAASGVVASGLRRVLDAPAAAADPDRGPGGDPPNVVVLPPLWRPSLDGAALSALDGVVLVFDAGRSTVRQAEAALRTVAARQGVIRAIVLVEGITSEGRGRRR